MIEDFIHVMVYLQNPHLPMGLQNRANLFYFAYTMIPS